MWSCQYCALSERCQFYQIENLSTPLKNCAIATLQPHNSSPRLSGQWNIHISSSKSEIISFRVPGAHNYNYFLNSLPQLNGELASRLTKSIFTITMMKWILMLCNLCKTSYNVLIHSHVIVLELKFWGEFRFPGVSICKCGLLEWTIFFKRTNLHTTAFGDLRCFGCVFTFE